MFCLKIPKVVKDDSTFVVVSLPTLKKEGADEGTE